MLDSVPREANTGEDGVLNGIPSLVKVLIDARRPVERVEQRFERLLFSGLRQ